MCLCFLCGFRGGLRRFQRVLSHQFPLLLRIWRGGNRGNETRLKPTRKPWPLVRKKKVHNRSKVSYLFFLQFFINYRKRPFLFHTTPYAVFTCYVIEKHDRSLIMILDNSHLHRDIGNLQNKYAPKRVQMKDHICSHINPYESAQRNNRIRSRERRLTNNTQFIRRKVVLYTYDWFFLRVKFFFFLA